MIKQTYTFCNLPKWIRENENGKRDKYIHGIERDMESEIGYHIPTVWKMDVTGHDLILQVEINEEDARFLECALHNLHAGKLII
jgi:hypothetical protein